MKYLITVLLVGFTIILAGCVQNGGVVVDDTQTTGDVIKTGVVEDMVLTGESYVETGDISGEEDDENKWNEFEKYGYTTDGINVFFRGTKIIEANRDSFTIIGLDNDWDTYYGKDDSYIYLAERILTGLNPKRVVTPGRFVVKDDNVVYYLYEEIIGADAQSFEVIEHESNNGYVDVYSKDKFKVYHRTTSIEGVDVNSFEILYNNESASYTRDSSSLYYFRSLVVGVEMETFQMNGPVPEDENFTYEYGVKKQK